MPLIKAYNIDSDFHGLKSHSIFKSVYTVEASWKGTFGHLIQTASAESRFSLEDLRRRSIDPTTPFGVPSRSLLRPVHAHRSSSCAVGATPPSTRGSTAPPPFSKHPGVRTRGEHPSHVVISRSIIPAPAQLLAGVSCAAAEPFLLRSTFSGTPVSVLRPRSCLPCRAERV
jgi:hypothetical protein